MWWRLTLYFNTILNNNIVSVGSNITAKSISFIFMMKTLADYKKHSFRKFFFLTFDSPFWIVSLYQSSVSSCIPPCIINAIPFHRIFHPSWIEKKENFFSCPIFLYGILFKSILIDRHHYVLYQYKYSYELQSSDKKKRSPFKWW